MHKKLSFLYLTGYSHFRPIPPEEPHNYCELTLQNTYHIHPLNIVIKNTIESNVDDSSTFKCPITTEVINRSPIIGLIPTDNGEHTMIVLSQKETLIELINRNPSGFSNFIKTHDIKNDQLHEVIKVDAENANHLTIIPFKPNSKTNSDMYKHNMIENLIAFEGSIYGMLQVGLSYLLVNMAANFLDRSIKTEIPSILSPICSAFLSFHILKLILTAPSIKKSFERSIDATERYLFHTPTDTDQFQAKTKLHASMGIENLYVGGIVGISNVLAQSYGIFEWISAAFILFPCYKTRHDAFTRLQKYMMPAALLISHYVKKQNAVGNPLVNSLLLGQQAPQMHHIISMTVLLNISVNTGKTLRNIYNGTPTTLVDIDSIHKFQTYMSNTVDTYITYNRSIKEKQD